MTRILPILCAVALTSGCSPQPRGADYFVAHPEEAAKVVADCSTGAHRGDECVNAKAGLAAGARDARIEAYKKGF